MQSDNKSIFSILEDDFFGYAKKEFNLWLERKREYRDNVNAISDILGLKKKKRFDTSRSPKFWSGKSKSKNGPRIIIVSLNPGLQKKAPRCIKAHEEDWETFSKSRDDVYQRDKHKSTFYRRWYVLFSGLYDKPELDIKTDNFRFFDKNVLGLNLLPFHSNKSGFSDFKGKKLALVTPYVINLLDYIVKTKPKDICIFNGKAWDNLLFKRALIYNEIKDYNETKLIKKQKIKFFKYKNVKCVLFTKFLSSTGHEKMTDKKIRADTAKKIKCQYPTAKWRAR